jgi:hypothetical protein
MAKVSLADSDEGSWNSVTVKWLDTKYVDLVSMGQLRFNRDLSELGGYVLSQRVVADPWEGWTLGVGYSFVPFRGGSRKPWIDQHRMEFEATPRWQLTERVAFSARTRLELRWVENQEFSQRLRERPAFAIAMKNWDPLEDIFFSNEFFFDFNGNSFSQNRWVPAGLTFKLNAQSKLKLYYQLWSLKSGGSWSHSHVLGTVVSFAFCWLVSGICFVF